LDTLSQLQKIFGFDSFRENQEEIIEAILSGQDVFAVMPTGGGKSLCYQLPAAMMQGTCIVISPLISLMKDQVDAACSVGLRTAFLNSTLVAQEQQEVLDGLMAGTYDLVYLAPERLAMAGFMKRLKRAPISFVAVDEAHCISEWGHDFRPDYRSLSLLRQELGNVVVSAFTATATHRVERDIVERLDLKKPLMVRASFNRPNLFYQVHPRVNVNNQIAGFIKKQGDDPGIVYRMSRADVEKTSHYLCQNGINASPYHAGLDNMMRHQNQEDFNRDRIQVIVATVAFGMGIDKSNVRFVVHGDLPKNMESYYQETGRAGRDGEPAICQLFFSRGDFFKLRPFIEQITNSEERQAGMVQLNGMLKYGEHPYCRRRSILNYFGEEYLQENCKACDICIHGVEKVESTIDAQMVMSAMYRTGQRFGAAHIVDIIAGAKTKRILSMGHDRIKTYGVGSKKPKLFWRRIIDGLLADGSLKSDGGAYPTLQLTNRGEDILFGRAQFFSHVIGEEKKKSRVSVPEDYNDELFVILRQLRSTLAEDEGVPPFVVFSDRSLHEMCRFFPESEDEFLQINGVGEMKLQTYGDVFLAPIKAFVEDHPEIEKPTVSSLQPKPSSGSVAGETLSTTLELVTQGQDYRKIAEKRGLKPSTVASHIEKLFTLDKKIQIDTCLAPVKRQLLERLFQKHGLSRLKPVVEASDGQVNYDEARMVRGYLNSLKNRSLQD